MAAVFKKYKVKKLLLGLAIFNALADPALVVGEDYVAATDPQPLKWIQTKGAELTFEVEQLDRDLDDASLGWKSKMLVGQHFKISAEVEAAGSGTAGTEAAYDGLMQLSAFASDATSGTYVEYTQLDDDSWLDGTIYFYMEGALHKLLNCQSNVSWKFNNGEIPYYKFEVTGLYGGIVTASFPTPTFTQIKPAKVGFAQTTFLIGGTEYVLVNFNSDQKNAVSYFDLPGYEGVSIDDFAPEGEFEILRPALADFDPFAIANSEADAFVSLSLTHGKTAGNIIQITNPQIQLLAPSYGEFEGKSTYKIPFGCIGNNQVRTL
jgi:hypothetical protein